jgi:hypothetical protein
MYSFLNFFILCIFLIAFKANAQPILDTTCNQSSTIISIILPPNSLTSVPTNTNTFANYYLCGPNTELDDTLPNSNGCRNVFLNANSKLIRRSTGCFAYEVIYAKNSSTVVILSGSAVQTKIVHEPFATIIDLVGLANTFTCTSISFPIANCGVTSFTENKTMNTKIELFPNPADDILTIEFVRRRVKMSKSSL